MCITKVRIIEIFEADFNSILKFVLGRKSLYHSEDQGINNTQTHGPRPGQSIHAALTLTSNIDHLERAHMIKFSMT